MALRKREKASIQGKLNRWGDLKRVKEMRGLGSDKGPAARPANGRVPGVL